ncbi:MULTISPECIES: cytochrome c oxidase subunit II [Porticoccus]|jgi:cytochrome c oxidase subunit 2|uniref:cytochrome c oxidase subunit II n=1 Tax=Porticoccus TaxID=1123967 RepID=UPI000C0E2075|nr:cytochrome c oxidase subunit II [Porticoccus hydrocarbonoclasticus]PHS75096.1 MAG: cytochrome c oxidase subunit II [Porticoccus sp.]
MSRRARMLFALLLAPAMFLATFGKALADDAQRWAVNMPKGVTPVSNAIYDIHMIIFWICVVIAVGVFGVMFYSMYAHRKSKGAVAANFHENTTAEIVWTVIPAVLLIVMAIPATSALLQVYDASEAEMDIKVTGYQWKWQYEYLGQDVSFMSELATPESEIYNTAPKSQYYVQEVSEPLVIPANTKVRFLITAKDVIHSWWLPDLGVKKDAIPGLVNETWAYVNEPGIYRGACTELCGQGHAFMPVVVNVLEKEAYNSWLAEKKEAAAAERELSKKTFTMDELMAQGKEAYDRSCAACHQVNGQGIAGVFPSMIGGAITTGDITSHIDIVVNGKAGTAMQAFGGQLSEVDIAAIVTYERNAWGNNTGDVVQPIDILKHKQGQ